MNDYAVFLRKRTDKELDMAESIVNRELRSKVIMSEWVNGFLARTKDIALDPVTFAFSRFALNIAMCYDVVPPSYFLSSKVHHLLVSLLTFESDIVIGPALLGLLHLSLHNEMKNEIYLAGALPPLLKLMVHNKSMTILAQACRLCSSLAINSMNKLNLANSGCFHAILDLAASAVRNVDNIVKSSACAAVANIILQNDANRSLTIELDAIRPLIAILQFSSHEKTLLNALKALANIAYTNGYTTSRILISGGDTVIYDIINGGDTLRLLEITRVSLSLLANMCCTDLNQAHIGASAGLVGVAIRICEYGRYDVAYGSSKYFVRCHTCSLLMYPDCFYPMVSINE